MVIKTYLYQENVLIKIQKYWCSILVWKKEVKFLSQMLTPQFTTNFMMTFEVQEFKIEDSEDNTIWKFKLGNINNSQIDFFAEHESIRSLFHLSKDISHQIQSSIDRKKKKLRSKERVIRKLCEKIIKVLKLSLNSFANNIEEELETVKAYFQKQELQEQSKARVTMKCRRWIFESWVRIFLFLSGDSFIEQLQYGNLKVLYSMSMDSSQFFKSCQKYVSTLFKDGKRTSPDFQLLNELYVNIAGNQIKQETESPQINNPYKILIDLNFTIQDKYVSEMLLWDLQINSTAKTNNFVQIFLADIIYENNLKVDAQTFSDLRQQCIIQIKTQTLYKTLLKKHSNILLNFSTIQISQDIREYLIEINLKLTNENGQQFFEDSFEWDILNEQNNVQKFCQNLIKDEEIPSKYFSQLCYKIRTQINQELESKFDMLVKTFRSIHKDRQSPKLNTQTMTQLKKNIIYTMDVGLTANPDFNTSLPQVILNNSDLFSLLSRNVDILPEEFHEILMCRETGKSIQKESKEKISKNTAQEFLSKKGCRVDDNGYLGNFTTNYKLHRIWSKQIGND